MSYPQLESALSTADGFKRSVRYASRADTVLMYALLLCVLGVFSNAMITFNSLNGRPVRDYFWPLFFEVRNRAGNIEPAYWAFAWLPIIAVPVILILLIVGRLTRGGSVLKVHNQYRQAGFVAQLVPTGIPVVSSNKNMLFLIAGPDVPPDWVPAAIEKLRVKLNTDPTSSETKAFKFAVASATVPGAGTQAGQANKADPSLPEGLYICSQQNNQSPVRIAVPAGKDPTRLKLWPLKKNVPLI